MVHYLNLLILSKLLKLLAIFCKDPHEIGINFELVVNLNFLQAFVLDNHKSHIDLTQ